MNMKSITTMGIISLVITGCSSVSPRIVQPPRPNEIVMHASYGKIFRDVRSMVKDSDIVIQGTVLEILPARFIQDSDIKPEDLAALQADGKTPGLPFTDVKIKVEKVIKGHKKVKTSSEIIVVQTGGQIGGKVFYLEDEPLFVLGEQSILFLKDITDDPVQSPGATKYILNSSPQARFKIDKGLAKPVTHGNLFEVEFNSTDAKVFGSSLDSMNKESTSDDGTN